MRLDRLSVVLRPRTPWEAMDLGHALVRRHARAVWSAWFAVTLPAFLVINALTWQFAANLLPATLAMWWLKPLFDRLPLYVLSRAVFGEVPGTRQALRAAPVWRWGQIVAWLTWRRLHPARVLVLPVDLLEAPRGPARSARVRVLQQAIQSPAWGLSLVGLALEGALFLSLFVLVLMFVPVEFLSDSARAMADTFFEDPPLWAQLCANAALWAATSAVEPMAVGAGFGLYLNRRTQLEAWDVELTFRRLVERVRNLGQALAVVAMLSLPVLAALPREAFAAPTLAAQDATPEDAAEAEDEDADDEDKTPKVGLPALFGDDYRKPDPAFERSVKKAFEDPILSPKQKVKRWVPRNPTEDKQKEPEKPAGWVEMIGKLLAGIGEVAVWIVAGVLLALLLWRLPHWLPWVRDLLPQRDPLSPVVEHDDPVAVPLPSDVPAAVRRLWQAGQSREALALLYRASVERLADTLGTPMPPGATEAECLRRARRLPDTDGRARFADVVRSWQAAAYAHRLPDTAAFEALLAGWSRGFGVAP